MLLDSKNKTTKIVQSRHGMKVAEKHLRFVSIPRISSHHKVCLSDIHGTHNSLNLPQGDVLLITGDIMFKDECCSEKKSMSMLPNSQVADFGRGIP